MADSIQGVRHQSVIPYNKSYYCRNKTKSSYRTFFKGAAEYTLTTGERNNSLADNDHAVKKIVDDKKVHHKFREDMQRSKEEEI